MAASAAMGRTCGRPGDVSDWEEEHVLQWASQQPRLKPDLLDFMQRHEIHGDALLDPELLDDETFRQEVSVGQRFALKKAVGVLKAQQPARPPAQSAKRELFPFVPTKHGHQKNLLAIEGRVRGPSQAQLTVDEPENEQYLNSTRVGECSGVQCQNDSDDSEVAEDESSSAETAPCKSSDEEPGEEPEEMLEEEPEEMLEEELEFDTKSNEGDGDHFDYDGGSGSSSDWTPKPRTVRSRATALYPRKQLCKRSRRSFRTESATAATSATNPIQADSPRGDTYRPLKSIKQEPQTAASTSDVATTATTTATSIGATARTIAITATSAKSLVLSIKERYEAIYEEFASALLRNRTPRGRLVNEVSWRNIRYKVRDTVQQECKRRQHGLAVPPSAKTWTKIPGLEVGMSFMGQVGLLTAQLHGDGMAGIHADSNGAYSIVKAGGYSDDDDHMDALGWWYMGDGGNDTLGTKRQIADQTLSGGNLGLKKCVDAHRDNPGSRPIRVFIGTRGPGGPTWRATKRCIYAGRFNVTEMETRVVDGFTAYFFRMVVVEEDAVAFERVHTKTGPVTFSGRDTSKPRKVTRAAGETLDFNGILNSDLANGEELVPIPLINLLDNAQRIQRFCYRRVGNRCKDFVQHKLEVIRMEVGGNGRKEWGVRAKEPLPLGTVICSVPPPVQAHSQFQQKTQERRAALRLQPRVGNIGCLMRINQPPNCAIKRLSSLPASGAARRNDERDTPHQVVLLRAVDKDEELTLGRIKVAHYPEMS